MKTYNFPVWLLVGATLMAQDLTPRELFFAAPAIKAKAAATSGSAQSTRPPQPKATPPVEQAKNVVTRPPVSAPEVRLPAIIPAAYVSATPPLGMRYSLLLSRD